jgi:hypothetical protein
MQNGVTPYRYRYRFSTQGHNAPLTAPAKAKRKHAYKQTLFQARVGEGASSRYRWDGGLLAVTHDDGICGQHTLDSIGGCLCLALLNEADGDVDQYNGANKSHFCPLLEDPRNNSGSNENENENVVELVPETNVKGRLGGCR